MCDATSLEVRESGREDESTKPKSIDLRINASVEYSSDQGLMVKGAITNYTFSEEEGDTTLTIERYDNKKEEQVPKSQVMSNVDKPPNATSTKESGDEVSRENRKLKKLAKVGTTITKERERGDGNGGKVEEQNATILEAPAPAPARLIEIQDTDKTHVPDVSQQVYLQRVVAQLMNQKLSPTLKRKFDAIMKAHGEEGDFLKTWNALVHCVPKNKGVWEEINTTIGTFPSALLSENRGKSQVEPEGIPQPDPDSEDEKPNEKDQKRRKAYYNPNAKKLKKLKDVYSKSNEVHEDEQLSVPDMVAKIVTNLKCDKYPNYLKTRAPCRKVQVTGLLLSEFHCPTPFQTLVAYTNNHPSIPLNTSRTSAKILYLVLSTNTDHYADLESALQYFKHTNSALSHAFLCMRVLNKVPNTHPVLKDIVTLMRKFLISLVQ